MVVDGSSDLEHILAIWMPGMATSATNDGPLRLPGAVVQAVTEHAERQTNAFRSILILRIGLIESYLFSLCVLPVGCRGDQHLTARNSGTEWFAVPENAGLEKVHTAILGSD